MTIDGQIERDTALELLDSRMRADTREKALDILLEVARNKMELTADDVLEACTNAGLRFGDNRSLGAVMTRASKKLYIRPTEKFVLSRNTKKHASPTRVWASNVYVRHTANSDWRLWNDKD